MYLRRDNGLQAIRLLGDIADRTVLVIGASSAVGHYAAQLAVIRGAKVIGTVGSTNKAEHALATGIETTINYKAESVAERVKQLTAGRGVDAIVDMDFSSTVQLLGSGGLARRMARWFRMTRMRTVMSRFRFEPWCGIRSPCASFSSTTLHRTTVVLQSAISERPPVWVGSSSCRTRSADTWVTPSIRVPARSAYLETGR